MKYIKQNKYVKYIEKILVLDKYQRNEKVNYEINKIFTDYFLHNANFIYNLEINHEEVGFIAGAIDCDHKAELNIKKLDKIIKTNPEYRDLIKFQIKIIKTISLFNKHHIPEIIALCSLVPHKKIGSKLIELWEKELISKKYMHYQLFSDGNCNHEWYIKKGFKLIEKIEVDLKDFEQIKNKHDKFYIYRFEKKVIVKQ